MTGKRIADFGYSIGSCKRGPRNSLTDVPGVRVGHCTLREGRVNTGVTVILPCEDNPLARKLTAAGFVQNGFGKTMGLVQIEEMGTLETPIALTNTLSVGAVADGLVAYMTERCARDRVPLRSINPVVGETNDGRINDILLRSVREEHVRAAIEAADVTFEEGDVGAGTGTICHGLKGGIGSASRLVEVAGKAYTLGILVQSNHGSLRELRIAGRPIGQAIAERQKRAAEAPLDQGSIMVVLGTDLPVDARQLRRVLKRCTVGLTRCGSYLGHGSGDIMLGFTTANRVPSPAMDAVLTQQILTEHTLERVFYAAAEATEEAVLNSLAAASPAVALDGSRIASLAEYL